MTYWVDGGTHVTVAGASATVSVGGDGNHTVSFFATDGAGNASPVSVQAVAIDTAAPGAATIGTYPDPVNIANQAVVAVSGTAEANAVVTLTITDPGTVHTVSRTVTANSSGTWSATGLDVTALSDGTIVYRVTATDAAGNTGAAATVTAAKDTAAPTVAITAATNPVNGSTVTAAAASGTVGPAASVTLTVTDGTHTVSPAVTLAGSTWSVSGANLASLTDGTITFRATATDGAGNTGTATRTSTKDTAAPTVPALALGPTANASSGAIRQGGTYYIYANAADAAPGSVVTLAANVGTLTTGQTAVPLTATGGPFTAGGVTYTFRSAARTANATLAAGAKTVTVTATDSGANSATATGSVSVDNTAPAASTVALANRTGGVVGRPEVGDTITFGYSELIAPETLAPGWNVGSTPDMTNATVTFRDSPSGNGTNKDNDSVTVVGPSAVGLGTVGNLQGGVVPTAGGMYAFTATLHHAVVGAQTVLTITLTGLTTGGSAIGTGTTASYTWAPVAGPTDLATNPLSAGTATSAGVPF